VTDERWCIWIKPGEDDPWDRTNVVAFTIDQAWHIFDRAMRHKLDDYYAALVVPLDENPNEERSR
jgi:hypothetical protein